MALPQLPGLSSKFAAAVISAGILTLGIPQTIDSLIWRYAGVDDSAAARKAPQWAVAASASSALLQKADTWFDDPAARIRAGLLQLGVAYASTPNAPDREWLRRATANLTDGLSRAPASGEAWMMLGYTRLAAGDREGAIRDLRASLLVASFDPALAVDRCQLGLELWPELDSNERRMMSDQVRDAWKYHPRGLVALARRPPSLYWVAGALAEDPEQLAAFLKMAAR